MWAPLLQISPCTGKSPVATPLKVGPVSREFVSKLCSARFPSDRIAVSLRALRAFPLRHEANWPPREPISLCAGPGGRGGVTRRGGAVRAASTCRGAVRPPPPAVPTVSGPGAHSRPPGTPGTERWVPPHPARPSGAGASRQSCR